MTFHDLRATGITWCAVRGDEPLKIKQRAGHSTFSTTEGYIREAENLGGSFGQVFPPLPPSLLDIRPESAYPPRNPENIGENSGAAGNRTRVRKLRSHASTCVADKLYRPESRPSAGSSRR